MIFSYNWLKEYIKGRVPKPEKLAELLTLHSFEVTEVKKAEKDSILDVDILPNRGPDCFSHLGVARECSVLLNSKFQIPNSKFKEDKNIKAKDFVKVEVKNKMACPRYTAKVITDVKVRASPKWLKERLKVCGLKPINNIVDIANFVMLETGQPLHAFDLDKLEGPSTALRASKKIMVRYAKKRERIVTLDEKKYNLNPKILVIADNKKPIAIAGIKGGIIPAVDKKTKRIVIESANFEPQVIRRGSKQLNLRTDASLRFEHGIDPNLTEFATNRATFLIQKIAKGKPLGGSVDVYSGKISPQNIKLDLDYLNQLLGTKISPRKVKDILERLEFKIIEKGKDTFWITVPTFRLDISIPEDLIEEVGRIYGYDKIKPIFPVGSLVPPEKNLSIFWQNFTKNILKGAGFTEVYNYSFVGEKEVKIFKYTKKDLIEIENPVSETQKYLRPSLIPNLLNSVKDNIRNFEEIKIFELGKIFKKISSNRISGKRALTGLIFKNKEEGDIFYELKGVCDSLLEKLGIPNFWYDNFEPTPEESEISLWNVPKSAEIKVDHQEIGFLGEISPKILAKLKIGLQPTHHPPAKDRPLVVVFDFDFEKLQKLASEEHEFRPISKYPSALRDIAVLVPKTTLVEEVLSAIDNAGGFLVRDVDLFDIYEGEEIPRDKKNLAFHIVYQSSKRTLKSKEIDKLHQKIIKVLEKEKGWEVRK